MPERSLSPSQQEAMPFPRFLSPCGKRIVGMVSVKTIPMTPNCAQ